MFEYSKMLLSSADVSAD